MQQFTVPQFIDVEDKIFGPITVRQFLIMIVGFSIIALAYKFLILSAFIVVIVVDFCVFGSLAFLKINGMPMHFFILNFIETLQKPSIRVWGISYRENLKIIENIDTNDPNLNNYLSKKSIKNQYSSSRLNELSLVVDTNGFYRGE